MGNTYLCLGFPQSLATVPVSFLGVCVLVGGVTGAAVEPITDGSCLMVAGWARRRTMLQGAALAHCGLGLTFCWRRAILVGEHELGSGKETSYSTCFFTTALTPPCWRSPAAMRAEFLPMLWVARAGIFAPVVRGWRDDRLDFSAAHALSGSASSGFESAWSTRSDRSRANAVHIFRARRLDDDRPAISSIFLLAAMICGPVLVSPRRVSTRLISRRVILRGRKQELSLQHRRPH